MALLTCKNLTLGYDGHAVLNDISFEVHSGDYLCIVGENGSGKTTLMKTVLGLQKPLSGQITFGDGLRQNEIGYLPQQTAIQRDFPATVREIVLSGCQARCGRRPFYNREEKRLARESMERMNLTALSGRCYRELSGGQQQRVLLARALCATRKLLVLDEPVAGLDPKVTADMYALVRGLNREDGITILMISHDLATAAREATHILHVGSQVFFGTREEYLRSSLARRFLIPEDRTEKMPEAAAADGPEKTPENATADEAEKQPEGMPTVGPKRMPAGARIRSGNTEGGRQA